jgi:GrpB-like predicted nucleotidyltransferase (UPF0157 family)
MGREIFVTEYDPSWPGRFEVEREAIQRVFSPIHESIHHIGSTSVPGLVAKPTIDILVVLDHVGDIRKYDPQTIELGYRPRGECLDAGGVEGRFYYCKERDAVRTHHMHVCPAGHWQIAELLAFPAYSRAEPEVAAEYAEMKRAALLEGGEDNFTYMASKAKWLRPRIDEAVKWWAQRT